MTRGVFILGLNHRTAPVAVRERLAYGEDEIVAALGRLKTAAQAMGEVAILSTCNRVELIAVAADTLCAMDDLTAFLARDRAVEPALFEPALYRLNGDEAIRHLFRVGASLDSMVVGEPQILGQVKLAYAQAAEAGTVGVVLHRAFHKAFGVAKRVRRATLIGHGAVSVSSAAVGLARQIFDALNDKTVMLLGAGKMAELTARQLARQGVESLLITNRTFDRAVELARDRGGTAVPWDHFRPYLRIADVVIGSVATTRPLLGAEDFEGILRERRYRPMFLIDLGVPRNFHEGLNSLDGVYLYDIDDLGAVVLDSQGERQREAQRAEAIVELEVDSFRRWLGGLELVPAIKDIRSGIERMRDAELQRHRAWLAGLEPDSRAHIESLTRGIVNKIFHQVLTELRRAGRGVDGLYAAEVARRLLGAELVAEGAPLDDDDPFGDDEDESGI
jgi:glutamyl-tRNA reductase